LRVILGGGEHIARNGYQKFDGPVLIAGLCRFSPAPLQATSGGRLASKNGGEFQPSQFPIIAVERVQGGT